MRHTGVARRLGLVGTVGGLALAMAACSSSSSGGSTSGTAGSDIKMGVVLDITGVGANLGVPEKQTIEMLADQVNAAGGVNGRKIKLTIEDDTSTEDGAAKAMSKLLNTEKVDIVLGASRTGPSLAMRPMAEQAKKPMISLSANLSIVKDATWVFKTAQNDSVVLEKMVDDMKAKGITKVSLLRDASAFGEGISEMFTDLSKAAGISLVQVEKFATNATDFTAEMVKVRDTAPQALIIWGIPPAAGVAQAAAKRLLPPAIQIYQSHGIGTPAFFDAAGDAGDGLRAPLGRLLVADQLPDDDPQKKILTKFIADFKAKYNASPSTFAGHAYDGFWIAVEAMKKAGTDPQKLRDAIEATSNWAGVSGVFTMTPKDHAGLTKEALKMVTVSNKTWKLAS